MPFADRVACMPLADQVVWAGFHVAMTAFVAAMIVIGRMSWLYFNGLRTEEDIMHSPMLNGFRWLCVFMAIGCAGVIGGIILDVMQ